ncbi:hypothetical protein ACFLS9_01850 [Bacteroidota bacterium]
MIKLKSLIIVMILIYIPLCAQIGPGKEFGISVKGGIGIPFSDFADYYSMGYGGSVAILYNYSNYMDWYIMSGGSFWDVDNENLNKKLSELGIDANVDLDGSLRIIPLALGIKLKYHYTNMRFYAGLAVVFNFMTLETSGSITDENSTTPIPSRSESFTKTSLAVELGIAVPLSKKLEFDISGKFNAISDIENNIIPKIGPVTDPVRSGSIRYFNIHGGINYYF